MNQMTLDEALTTTGRNHPATSRAAAYRVLPKSGTQRARVLELIAAWGDMGATDDEIAGALRLPGNSVRPRRKELELGGFIRRSGKVRSNAYGNDCEIWILA